MEKNKNNEVYNPSSIEAKWQERWEKEGTYKPDLKNSSQPFYNLMMFPYPSAEGLHVGNMYAFTGADVYGRYKRLRGYDVFEPIGLDGFGIHSENYALKVGTHPMDQAEKSEKNFYRQLRTIGNGYDWDHTVETYKPEYYTFTQWVFIELFKAGLAYRQKSPVNFCPSCKTVLADEQVEDGACERCGSIVEKRDLEQWFFRITEYAEKLLEGLGRIDWTEKVKIAQKNWIGKSMGAKVSFRVAGTESDLSVFTTRPDTLYGATFMVVSPDHPLVERWMDDQNVAKYIKESRLKNHNKSEEKDKTGVFSGAYAINPINNQQIPIWIADYVLMSYGTGAIMAVPAHDERDFAFAKKYNLPIVEVVSGGDITAQAYTGLGVMVNSEEWNGLSTDESKEKAIATLEGKSIGQGFVNYHLRDWLISRQRYWGPPIPMIFCEKCAEENRSYFTTEEAKKRSDEAKYFFAPEKSQDEKREILASHMPGWYPAEIPVILPRIENYKPLGTGTSPLATDEAFVKTLCPACGSQAKRETDVSDTFLDSSWYFLRYLSAHNSEVAWEKDLEKKWLPVASYIGGAEHSVLHLLYVRFLTKFFKDAGYITDFDEPFPKFFAHGLIIKDGAKMSKSKGNVVVPDEYIAKFGADALRTYLMFIGPFSGGGDFRDSGIEGIYKFLKRVWALGISQTFASNQGSDIANSEMNRMIGEVTVEMENLRYNTALAKIMTFMNVLKDEKDITRNHIASLLILLSPFAPHMTEELWERMGNDFSIHHAAWPQVDETAIQKGAIVIAVQINGKLRLTLDVTEQEGKDQAVLEEKALAQDVLKKHLNQKVVKKVIFVPGKILNFVV
jgi:leucyl-tRNA synthetase